jgi:hypothetical protein
MNNLQDQPAERRSTSAHKMDYILKNDNQRFVFDGDGAAVHCPLRRAKTVSHPVAEQQALKVAFQNSERQSPHSQPHGNVLPR